MAQIVYKYDVNDFVNKKFDLERLRNQVNGMYKGFTVEPYGTSVLIFADKLFTEIEKTAFDLAIQSHTGEPLDILIKDTSNGNRLITQEIIGMAYDREDLNPIVPLILKYFKSILDDITMFVYYGDTEGIVNRITQDVAKVTPLATADPATLTPEELKDLQLLGVLLGEVTAPNAEFPNGVKAYEFFIGKITKAI